MPNVRPPAPLLLLAAACLAAACGDKGPQTLTEAAAGPAARVKFYNFGVNAPGVNFYANDTKVTAVNSTTGTEDTLGTRFGSAAAGGFYAVIAPGQYTLTGRIAAPTDKNLPVASVQASLADGKAYSFFMSGVYSTAAKQVDAFLLEDAIPAPVAFDTTYIRFVNAIANAGPLVLVGRTQTTPVVEFPISAGVAYKAAGPFTAFGGSGLVDLVVRNPGSTAAVFSRTGVTFVAGRVYTVTARGDITVTSTTAANRPQLDNTANR